MNNFTNFNIPAEYIPMVSSLCKGQNGYVVKLVPGYYYIPERCHSFDAETETELLEKFRHIKAEEFDLVDDYGSVQGVLNARTALSLIGNLRPDYCLVSRATDELLEDISEDVKRATIDYIRIPIVDRGHLYRSENYLVRILERDSGNGDIQLIPDGGRRAVTKREWKTMPKFGLDTFCNCLERQINQEKTETQQALIRIQGDRKHPLMAALIAFNEEKPDALNGLIEVAPADGEALTVSAVRVFRPQYLRACRDLTQLLQSHGFEDAADFLDRGDLL